jgi:bacteriocin resistance YdeI/OmpD-like protein/uncharacterized protein DUF1905
LRRYSRTIAAVARQRFTGTLESARGGGAVVVLPDEVLIALGGGSRFRVTGSLNGVEFESSTMGMGAGRVCLGVHKATRATAGVDVGDAVEIEIERDMRPRTIEVPEDLAAALAGDPVARTAFERQSFTHRREQVESVTGAKRTETRARRIAKILEQLQTGG